MKHQDRRQGKPDSLEFTFDDSIFSPLKVKETDPKLFVFGTSSDQAHAAEETDETMVLERDDQTPGSFSGRQARLFVHDLVTSRNLSLALGFLGSAILFISLLFYLYYSPRGERRGSELLAQWRSALAPQKPPAAVDREVPATSLPKTAERIIVPAVLGPLSTRAKTASPPAVKTPPKPRTVVPDVYIPAEMALPVEKTAPAPAIKAVVKQQAVIPEIITPVAVAEPVPQTDAADEAESLFSLAEEFQVLGDRNKAEQIYRRLVDEKKQAGRAALALGGLYIEQGKFVEATQMYELSKKLYENPNGSTQAQ